jgi:hypothetical protein
MFSNIPLFPQSMLIRRDFLNSMGGWNCSIRGFGDCHDFLLRATNAGKVGYLDPVLVRIRCNHGDHMASDFLVTRTSECTILKSLLLTYPQQLRQLVRPDLAWFCVCTAAECYKRGRPGLGLVNYLRGAMIDKNVIPRSMKRFVGKFSR